MVLDPAKVASPTARAGLGRVFWWLWAGWLLSSLATFVMPFLALYLSSRGLRPTEVGRVAACFGLGSLIAGPVAGALADALGRRRTLFVALLAEAVFASLLAFLEAPLPIAATVLAFGAAAVGSRPPLRAIVSDVVPRESLPRAFGWIYWAENLGTSASLLAGGALAAHGWAAPFLVDAATTLGFAGVILLRVPETRPVEEAPSGSPVGYGVVLRDRVVVTLLSLVFAVHFVYAQSLIALPLDMAGNGYGPAAFGATMLVSALLVVVLQPFSARALRDISLPRALALGAVLTGLGLGAFGWCVRQREYAGALILWTLGEIVFYPTASVAVSHLAPTAARGRYMAAYGLCLSFASVLAPLAGPAVLETLGRRVLWPACLAVALLAAGGFLAWGKGRGRTLTPPASP
ncbi:MAG TPA: MFS transporter [Anaeromyxobacter sp.]|nr:MFS transporter [Anaeromyxobacter sp.]